MSEAVIAALITGACAIVAQMMISHSSSQKLYSELDKRMELSDTQIQGKIDVINTKIGNLTEKVEKHNSLMEKTYRLEEQMKVANHRIDDLEKIEKA